jgi:hypothetical protein
MKRALVLLLLIAGTAFPQVWHDASRGYRVKITADSAQISGTAAHLDKPLYFNLEKLRGTGIFQHFNADGSDIRIYRKGKTEKLKRELMNFSKADSTGQIYFKTDSLSKDVREFYLYYEASTDAESNADSVWTGYALVMHFEETANYKASNNSAITATGGANRTTDDRVPGVIGYAADFDEETADTINISPSILIGTDDMTLTLFIAMNAGASGYDYILTTGATGTAEAGFGFNYYKTTGQLDLRISDGSTRQQRFSSDTVTANGTWKHAGFGIYRTSGDNKKWWKNGVVDLGTPSAFFSGVNIGAAKGTVIGGVSGIFDFFYGKMDELRLYRGKLTNEWVTTEYKNLTSPTYWTAGSQEILPVEGKRAVLISGSFSSIMKKVPLPETELKIINYNLEAADVSSWKVVNSSSAVVSYGRNTTSPVNGTADFKLQVVTASSTPTAHPALYAALSKDLDSAKSYRITTRFKVISGTVYMAAVQLGAGYKSVDYQIAGDTTLVFTTTCNRNDYQNKALYYFFRGDYAFNLRIDDWTVQEITVPQPILAVNNTENVLLTWTNVTGEDGYRIFRSSDGGATFIKIDSVNANIVTYTDASALYNIDYKYYVAAYAGAVQSLASNTVTGYRISGGANYVTLYYVNPTKFEKLTGTNLPAGANVLDSLKFNAAPGEYEPASFIIKTTTALNNVEVSFSDLSSGSATIPGSALDPYIAKVWWQAGINTIYNNENSDSLVQELLIKNDALVQVNYSSRLNQLLVKNKTTGATSYATISNPSIGFPSNVEINDAAALQPFTVGTDRYKQLYVILKVPAGTPAGTYKGTMTIRNGSVLLKTVGTRIKVYPFSLENPMLLYGCYYSAGVVSSISDSYSFGGSLKDTAQYRIEMQDIKNHGILYPFYNNNEYSVNLAMSIRDKAGLPKDKVFIHTLGAFVYDAAEGNSTNQSVIDAANRYKNAFASYGVPLSSLYFYGYDEANTSRYGLAAGELTTLEKAVRVYSALKSAISGIKIFQSISPYGTNFTVGSPYIDVAVMYSNRVGTYPYESGTYAILPEVTKWKNIGKPVYAYNNPQYTYENPEVYRKNHGLFLWRDGFTGETDWKYQSTQGHTWNDWDDAGTHFRDPNMTYPITKGVISTVQWEGVREAVDDMRYLNTLIVSVNLLPSSSFKTEMQTYINNLKTLSYNATGAAQLDAIRAEIARRIILVKKQLGQL